MDAQSNKKMDQQIDDKQVSQTKLNVEHQQEETSKTETIDILLLI